MRPLRQAKSMADIEKYLKNDGWYLARTKKHNVWKCDCGKHTITLPGSGSTRGHAFKNYIKMVEKAGH